MKLRFQIHISSLLIILFNICLGGKVDQLADSSSKSIIFVSDTQAPLWFEHMYMPIDQNTKATDLIFEQILKKKHSAVFHLGDLVALGYSQMSWEAIDQFLPRLKEKEIPFYPILGNHELIFRSQTGFAQFMKRFPDYSPTGSLHIVGGIAIILLNSNFDHMSRKEIDLQQSWYQKTITECEINPEIKGIIVGCHHPPYTDSGNVSFNKTVRDAFVPPFIKIKKSLLFLTGHSHTLEHFVNQEKNFLIIGGGGGPRHNTSDKNDDLPEEVTRQKHAIENFFYLEIMIDSDHLNIKVQMLKTDFSGFHTFYHKELPYNLPLHLLDMNDE
jgi:hypothetical protein